MKNIKKLSIFLAICTLASIFSIFSVSASMEDHTCGENLFWNAEYIDEGWTLTISGTGDMTDYASYGTTPWSSYRYNIKHIIIENGVTSIGNKAFSKMENLFSVKFGNTLKRIGEYAFEYCESLESIDIPDSVETIEKRAFHFCESLKSATIGNSVTKINEYTFLSCVSMTDLVIGDTVKTIFDAAFADCTSLKNITFGKKLNHIGSQAFKGCSAIEALSFPASLSSVGSESFSFCSSLTSVAFPEGFTNVYSYAFINCPILEKVKFPSTLTNIGNEAFYECPSIKSVELPSSLSIIGNYALGHYYDYTNEKRVRVENFTIYGEKETESERYAERYGFKFVDINATEPTIPPSIFDVETMTMPNVVESTKASEIISMLSTYGFTVAIKDKNGNVLQGDENVGTGCIVSLGNGNEFTVIVLGDVDGTGIVDSTDYLKIKSMFISASALEGVYATAADADKNGEINSTDYLRIKSYFLGSINLYE